MILPNATKLCNNGTVARITIIGTGYVGLTTGVCLNHLGHDVICADVNWNKIINLGKGRVSIHEDQLHELVNEGISKKTLSFTTEIDEAVAVADFVFLCLPTPENSDGSADMSYIETASKDIKEHLNPDAVVVIKSTVLVGTSQSVEELLGNSVVSNPEFLREGTAVSDFFHPDRIVIGASNMNAAHAVALLYDKLDTEFVFSNTRTAELIKYTSNAFLATKLSFMNAMALICERVGADVDDLIEGIGHDPRIGNMFLQPSPAWGGSCFPKDTKALLSIAKDCNYDFKLLQAAIDTNDEQIQQVISKIEMAHGDALCDATVTILGLTFKANTDDLRQSPALRIVDKLLELGVKVRAWDPTVEDKTDSELIPNEVEICVSPLVASMGADVLVITTEWYELTKLDAKEVAQLMKKKAVVDTRNILPVDKWLDEDFDYQGIGR